MLRTNRPFISRAFATLTLLFAIGGCAHHSGGGSIPAVKTESVHGILHVLPLFYYQGGAKGTQPVPVLAGVPTTGFYGVTNKGGQYNYGTIYQLVDNNGSWNETVIHSFNIRNLSDGAYPAAPLAPLKFTQGQNLFGTTEYGGKYGQGTVFEIGTASPYTFKLLYSFKGGSDGALPASLIHVDSSGNLIGTTLEGGCTQTGGGCCPIGCGTVYKLTPSGTSYKESVIYAFKGGSDGIYPWGGVESMGTTLYGTTYAGGNNACSGGGCGTVYQLVSSGNAYTYSTVYSFAGTDGAHPHSRLLALSGTLYGATVNGGSNACPNGCGTVFSMTPSGTLNWSHAFTGDANGDGQNPYVGLTYQTSSNLLFGTTLNGGDPSISCANVPGCGTIFYISPDGQTYSSFWNFKRPQDGLNPDTAVFQTQGTVYGTASDGGDATHNHGYVFDVQ